jgi:hypothetical protein
MADRLYGKRFTAEGDGALVHLCENKAKGPLSQARNVHRKTCRLPEANRQCQLKNRFASLATCLLEFCVFFYLSHTLSRESERRIG